MITLYTARTGNGHRVSIMLEEVGLPYQTVSIDFAKGEHQGAALKAVNPMGQIPAIVDTEGPDGATINLSESAAILRYLARKTGKLLPGTALEEMEADRWTSITAGGLQSAPVTLFVARLLGEEQHAPIMARQHEVIARYLTIMEARLAQSEYLAGPDYCYVDILGFTLVNSALPMFGVKLDAYPSIVAWKARIDARPAVQRGLQVPA
ncbi:glutathione S-transferase family protein [Sphingobium aromaticivastans]|uniref:glutathione S-transferase family protein n=1 Tax=Sphingobium aromaticivastans TaxID=1778665 RepID=UPI003016C73C